MKTKITWRRRKKSAGRSGSTVRTMSPAIELFSQICRVHSAIA